jgi:transposase-like protein
MPKQHRRRFDPEWKKKVVAEAKAAGSIVETAAKHGVALTALRNWCQGKSLGVPGGDQKYISPEAKAQAVAEYAAGAKVPALAAKYKVGGSSIQHWIKLARQPTHREMRKSAGKGRRARGERMGKVGRTDLVVATNAALQRVNGSAPAHLGPHLRELLLRLRGSGVEIVNLEITGGSCTVTYQTKETFEL